MRGMGKAMMGTGEASGEDRARHAAEAAIANPLLDDVSMQGARGLLISIAGGPDLTLYEVDEAASRIREEVDPEANIILGAMFDEELVGTVRVSVVATGTDATMVQALEPMKPNAQRSPLSIKRAVVEQQPMAAQAPYRQPQPDIAAQVEQAVAHAITHPAQASMQHVSDDGIMVEPYVPAVHGHDFDEQPRFAEPPIPSVHVPGSAARPDGQRRMPRTEELPAVARKSLEAQDRHEAEPRNARALFKRLASNVGLALRSEAPLPAPQRPSSDGYGSEDAAARSAIESGPLRGAARPSHPGAAGHFDAHGRPLQQPAAKEHLEIPAFLRKHG
jgi:cell division protein FtsZ